MSWIRARGDETSSSRVNLWSWSEDSPFSPGFASLALQSDGELLAAGPSHMSVSALASASVAGARRACNCGADGKAAPLSPREAAGGERGVVPPSSCAAGASLREGGGTGGGTSGDAVAAGALTVMRRGGGGGGGSLEAVRIGGGTRCFSASATGASRMANGIASPAADGLTTTIVGGAGTPVDPALPSMVVNGRVPTGTTPAASAAAGADGTESPVAESTAVPAGVSVGGGGEGGAAACGAP